MGSIFNFSASELYSELHRGAVKISPLLLSSQMTRTTVQLQDRSLAERHLV